MANQSGGITFLPALLLLFIALKLTHVISWSWLWVLSPIWIPMAAFMFLLIGLLIAEAVSRD